MHCDQSDVPSSTTSIVAAVALTVMLIGSALSAEERIDAISWSVHFQARADWMRGLDGNPSTVATFERRAELLWRSVPMDRGMPVFGDAASSENAYQPDAGLVLAVMARFAEMGPSIGPAPLCIEDGVCSRCTDLLGSIVKQASS